MAVLATDETRWAFDLDGYVVFPSLLPPGTTAADLADPGSPAGLLIASVIRGHAGGDAPLHHRAAYDGAFGA